MKPAKQVSAPQRRRKAFSFTIRKAVASDAGDIHALINKNAKKNRIIPRALNNIYEHLRDFLVAEAAGKTVGVCALQILWDDLAEIRSLSIEKRYQGRGIGKALIAEAISEARQMGMKRVFALTYNPGYFISQGFRDIEKSALPQKIWSDCVKCPLFPGCDELAVIIAL